MEGEDRLTALYAAVPDDLPPPWAVDGRYRFSRSLLTDLVQVQVKQGTARRAQSGGLALAVDVWIASELRRAGLDPEAVWPRASRPRILPPRFARAVRDFRPSGSEEARQAQRAALDRVSKALGGSRSEILGGLFHKEVDVVVAELDRGLELGVSTKTMTGSAAKNVGNRYEEAAGDLFNLRKRFPLATLGYAFLVTSNVPRDEPAAWMRICDMCSKLTALDPVDEAASYDASCLVVIDWEGGSVRLREELVPDELSADQFFETILRTLFRRSPVSEHGAARTALASAEASS